MEIESEDLENKEFYSLEQELIDDENMHSNIKRNKRW